MTYKQVNTVMFKKTAVTGACILVIAVLLFIKTFSSQITGFVIGIVLALVGMGLDIAGEIALTKDYKARGEGR